MPSGVRLALMGAASDGGSRFRSLLVVVGVFAFTFVAFSLTTYNFASSVVVALPALLLWGIATDWMGYNRQGLIMGWGVTFAALAGQNMAYYLFDLSHWPIEMRVEQLLNPGSYIFLLLMAVVLGTVPCVLGYLRRWRVSPRDSKSAVVTRPQTLPEFVRSSKFVAIGLVFAVALLLPVGVVPVWIVIWGVLIDLALVASSLLAVAVIGDAILEGISVGSIGSGVLALFTLLVVGMSMSTLYGAQSGGVFFGGFFSLLFAVILAVVTVVVDLAQVGGFSEGFWSGEGAGPEAL